MGEGGCVLTNQPLLKRLVESFRDWGRDCWCGPGDERGVFQQHARAAPELQVLEVEHAAGRGAPGRRLR